MKKHSITNYIKTSVLTLACLAVVLGPGTVSTAQTRQTTPVDPEVNPTLPVEDPEEPDRDNPTSPTTPGTSPGSTTPETPGVSPIQESKPVTVIPNSSGGGIDAQGNASVRILGFPTWYNRLPMDSDGTVKITDMLQLWVIALNILEMLIIAAGYLAIGFFAWGGFTYMAATGDPGKIGAAKNTLLNAVIGLVIVLGAVAIIDFVQKGIQGGLS